MNTEPLGEMLGQLFKNYSGGIAMERIGSHNLLETVFYPDGTLRDIYMFNTDIDDWQRLLEYLISEFEVKLYIDGNQEQYEQLTAKEIFKSKKDRSIYISIDINNISICCHFFSIEEIELDVSPNGITDIEKANKLLTLLQNISNKLNKDVHITPENTPEESLFIIRPI